MKGSILVDGRGGVFWQIEPASGYVGQITKILEGSETGDYIAVANGNLIAQTHTEAEAALRLVQRVVTGPITWTLHSVRGQGSLTLT